MPRATVAAVSTSLEGKVRNLRFPLIVALILIAVPSAFAHAGPNPTGTPFHRLLASRLDACGPEAAPSQDCNGSDRLIDLDLKEWWDGTQDQMTFRLYLDTMGKQAAFPITDAFSFKLNGQGKTLSIQTSDDATYTNAAGYDQVGSALSIHDGSRYLVDSTVSFARLGAGVGDKITEFVVTSTGARGPGDKMPGVCQNSAGPCTASNNGEYIAGGGSGSYALRGSGSYVTISDDGPANVAVGEEHIIQLTLANPFQATAQTYALSVAGADGVQARFHDPQTNQYSDTLNVPVDRGAQGIVHLAVQGQDAGKSGTLTVTVLSSQGGRSTHDVAYRVDSTGSGTGNSSPATPNKNSPAPGMLLVAVGLAAVALGRRRSHA